MNAPAKTPEDRCSEAAEELYQTLLRDFDDVRTGIEMSYARAVEIRCAMSRYADAREARDAQRRADRAKATGER